MKWKHVTNHRLNAGSGSTCRTVFHLSRVLLSDVPPEFTVDECGICRQVTEAMEMIEHGES